MPGLCPRIRHAKKRPEIAQILRTSDVIASKDLQRNEVAGRRDVNGQLRQQLDGVGGSDNFGLDSRRGEQQINDGNCGLERPRKPHRREAAYRILLDERPMV